MNYSVSKYVNTFLQKPLSTREVLVVSFTFKEIPTSTVNTIYYLYRFNENDSSVAGVDISANGTVATNVITLSDIWLGAETPAVGNYRVVLVLQDTESSPANRQEANYIVPVI